MIKHISSAIIGAALLAACDPSTSQTQPTPTLTSTPTPVETPSTAQNNVASDPDWVRDAVIYEINVRQYSEAGTFDAVREDLPRIKALGVDILWLMPIYPIGEVRRKGPMGSPYAVQDYFAVNPEFGTDADFRALVDAAHAKGFKVILDWVANHSAWDNPMITENPHWYTTNEDGEIIHPEGTDWEDVADFNYDDPDMRAYMRDALLYWVEEFNIDGYRCDVAGMVPTDFWNDVRPQIDAIKPVFMLAEWQEPELHEAFDATYAWRWKEIMQDIVNGKADAADLSAYYQDDQTDWPRDAMRMTYTSNHDQNTWDGLPQEIYGNAYDAAMVLQFTGDGIPLIYSGQECLNPNRLEFFEKDPIVWNCDAPINGFFRDLAQLKTDNPALHNGAWGATMTEVENTHPDKIISFIRTHDDGNRVLVVANLSDSEQSYALTDTRVHGEYQKFGGSTVSIDADARSLPAWGWAVYVQN